MFKALLVTAALLFLIYLILELVPKLDKLGDHIGMKKDKSSGEESTMTRDAAGNVEESTARNAANDAEGDAGVKRIGVRFCGGCNPRYDRGAAYRRIAAAVEAAAADRIALEHAVEGTVYDGLLIIGGCQACCAGYDQFTYQGPVLKMYEEDHVTETVRSLLAMAEA